MSQGRKKDAKEVRVDRAQEASSRSMVRYGSLRTSMNHRAHRILVSYHKFMKSIALHRSRKSKRAAIHDLITEGDPGVFTWWTQIPISKEEPRLRHNAAGIQQREPFQNHHDHGRLPRISREGSLFLSGTIGSVLGLEHPSTGCQVLRRGVNNEDDDT